MRQAITQRRVLWPAAIAACGALVCTAIVRMWMSGDEQIAARDLQWRWLAASVGCLLALVLTYAVAWWCLLRALGAREAPFARTVRLFLLSWPGRYAPASLPHYGSRLALAPQLGVSRAAVAASLVYENLFVIAGAGGVSIALILISARDHVGGSGWIVAALAATGLSLGSLHPRVVRTVIRVAAARFSRLRPLEAHVVPLAGVLRVGSIYAAGALFTGLAFYCALRGVSANGDAPLLLSIATYNLAGIAGMLAVAVPSGLGVREGAVVALIGATVSAPVALTAAVAVRLAGVVADLTPMAVVGGVEAVRRLRLAASR